MYFDGELDESKFVLDYNEELILFQSSYGEFVLMNMSSFCLMDLMILDEVCCLLDEVEDFKEFVNQFCVDQMKEVVLDKFLLIIQEGVVYYCFLCQISLSGYVKCYVFRVYFLLFWGGNCN